MAPPMSSMSSMSSMIEAFNSILDAHAQDTEILQHLAVLPFYTDATPENGPEHDSESHRFEQEFHTLSGTGQSALDEIELPKGGRRLSLSRPRKPRQVSSNSMKFGRVPEADLFGLDVDEEADTADTLRDIPSPVRRANFRNLRSTSEVRMDWILRIRRS